MSQDLVKHRVAELAAEIQESEDELIRRHIVPGRITALVDDGVRYDALAIWDGEDPEAAVKAMGFTLLATGSQEDMLREAERLRLLRDVMES